MVFILNALLKNNSFVTIVVVILSSSIITIIIGIHDTSINLVSPVSVTWIVEIATNLAPAVAAPMAPLNNALANSSGQQPSSWAALAPAAGSANW